jgi:pimeloyl-ACP methyl ester carboxylesterase
MQALKTSPPVERMALAAPLLPPTADGWAEEDRTTLIAALAQFELDTITLTSPDIFLIDWRTMLPHITCPLLLLTGDPQHGTRADPDDVAAMTTLWRNGQHIAFTEAGHLIHRDAFERYIGVVKPFFKANLIPAG